MMRVKVSMQKADPSIMERSALCIKKVALAAFLSFALTHWSLGHHRDKPGAGYARQMQAFALASRRKRLPRAAEQP